MSGPDPAILPKDEPLSPISDAAIDATGDSTSPIKSDPPPTKRKGGRKPIYATVEERKQRNRQAQAAFRGRRTEYIKQLEASTKDHDDNTDELRQKNEALTDECTKLRYKTSLLERLLDEHSIDYRSELQRRTKNLFDSPPQVEHERRIHQDTIEEIRRPSKTQGAKAAPEGPSINNTASSSAQPSSTTSGPPSVSSFPSPSSFDFSGLSPSMGDRPFMNSSGAARRTTDHRPGSMTHSASYQQHQDGYLPHEYGEQGPVNGDVKSMPQPNNYSHASHYDYLRALQQSSRPAHTSSYLGQHRMPNSPYVPETGSPPYAHHPATLSDEDDANQMPSGFTTYPFDEMRQAAQHRSWMRQNGVGSSATPSYYP